MSGVPSFGMMEPDAERGLASVYAPNYLLPSQITPVHSDSGSMRLVCAVVDQAVTEYCLERIASERRERALATVINVSHWKTMEAERNRQKNSAEAWIFKSDDTHPWTFHWCCSVLGSDVGWMRKKIRELPEMFNRPRRTRPFLSMAGASRGSPRRVVELRD